MGEGKTGNVKNYGNGRSYGMTNKGPRHGKNKYRDSSPFDFAEGQNDDVKQNKNKQQQMRGFFAALRMTT
jgi:hypothetical protein